MTTDTSPSKRWQLFSARPANVVALLTVGLTALALLRRAWQLSATRREEE